MLFDSLQFLEANAAESARKELHGTHWPSSNPKILQVEFASLDEVKHLALVHLLIFSARFLRLNSAVLL